MPVKKNVVAAPKSIELPKGVKDSDMVLPKWDSKVKLAHDRYEPVELHYTERFGWVVKTLFISRARNKGTQDRSYGYTLKDKQLVSVGNGPHVLKTISVYVKESRVKALGYLLETRTEGMSKAGDYRDARSSRRANTIARRRSFGF